MWPIQDECLLKREQFAVTLRKKKKVLLLQSKRLKLDKHFEHKGTLSQLCEELVVQLEADDDFLSELTNLRRLLSNEEYITINLLEIQSSKILVKTIQ